MYWRKRLQEDWMKLDFGKRNMDVATFPFRFMRILALAGTGGCESMNAS